MGLIYKKLSEEVQQMPHVNTSPLQPFILGMEWQIIIASFMSESDLSLYVWGQSFIC